MLLVLGLFARLALLAAELCPRKRKTKKRQSFFQPQCACDGHKKSQSTNTT
jgi:hypothetical protein